MCVGGGLQKLLDSRERMAVKISPRLAPGLFSVGEAVRFPGVMEWEAGSFPYRFSAGREQRSCTDSWPMAVMMSPSAMMGERFL
jgi:hypothetical protein